MHYTTGPGPGAYALPPTIGFENHDRRKQRMPQYSFAPRTNMMGPDPGPGPGAYQVDKLTRYGKGGGLQYTMAPQTRIIGKLSYDHRNRYTKTLASPYTIADKRVAPGPGAHAVHERPFFKGVNAPAYSMGARNNFSFKKDGPGPSAYKVEIATIRPTAPVYSMYVRCPLRLDIRII